MSGDPHGVQDAVRALRHAALNAIASDCAAVARLIRAINRRVSDHNIALDVPPEKPFLELISKAAALKHKPEPGDHRT